eukprot:403354640
MKPITSILLLLTALPAFIHSADDCFFGGSSQVLSKPSNPFWDETHIQLYAEQTCQIQTFDDSKIEFIYPEIAAYYYKFTKDESGQCKGGLQTDYYSGGNLLVDYDKVCGYVIYIQNLGENPLNFRAFIKSAIMGYQINIASIVIGSLALLGYSNLL